MANIASSLITGIVGTELGDTIIGIQGGTSSQTFQGLGGHDVIIGDSANVYQKSETGTNSFATAANIGDNPDFWSMLDNPDIGDPTIPHTTVLGTGTNENHFFRIEVGAGETLTVDIDYGDGGFGGAGFVGAMRLYDQNQQEIPGIDYSLINNGGRGSVPTGYDPSISHDPYRQITNTTGQSQTYYINVLGNGTPVPQDYTYVMNVSLTGHSVGNAQTGPDHIDGGYGDDILYGIGGNDTLIGGRGADTMLGGDGDDVFEFREGDGVSDVLDGGPGFDTAELVGDVGNTDFSAHMFLNLYDVTGIEAASISGIGNGEINVDAAQLTSIQQFNATDHIGHASRVNIHMGSETNVSLSSAAFNDFLDSDDVIQILGDNDAETMTGSVTAARFFGSGGDDTITGGDKSDQIYGGYGDDNLVGGTSFIDKRDLMFGGVGNDTMDGGYGNDEIRGEAGSDSLIGGAGEDLLIGGDDNDILTGQNWSDLLFGGNGDDFINGGFGFDRVNGGAGADRFYHQGILDHGTDWIQDFSNTQGDRLVFGGSATQNSFQVNYANTAGAGDAGVDEAFVIHVATGQILWALVDGADQANIFLSLGGTDFDIA